MSSEPPRIVLGVEDIDRKYEVLEKLAEGGMGAIYRARHLLLDEIRVIKTVRPQYRDDSDLRERFLREARVATHLHHSNIARIHDLSVGDDGTACIVMEFVHGINLADRLRRQPRLEQGEILELGRQTLDALGYLHQRKIVHRDISPDNVMLARDAEGRAQVKLIDLGIAKPLDGAGFQTKTAMFIGKVRYASPEQLGGAESAEAPGAIVIDGRSDLYSLGVVLYELLTGEFPIRGTSEASIIAGHLFHPPRSFAETDPDGRVSEPLRRVLLHALEKDPGHRFQSAGDFSGALDEAGRGHAAGRTFPTGARRPEAGREAPTLPRGATPAEEAPTVLAPGTGPIERQEGARGPGPTVLMEGPPRAAAGATRSRRRLALSAAALLAVLVVTTAAYLLSVRTGGETEVAAEREESQLAGIEFGNYKALVIGNSRYRFQPALETAARDAREMAHLLENRYGFEVHLLQDAERHDIVTALADLAATATEQDNLLIYFAGHGQLLGSDRAGNWLPVDAQPTDTSQWVSTRYDVSQLLGPSRARHVLVIADSCFSGSLAGAVAPRPAAEHASDRAPTREEVLAGLGRRSRLVLTSGELAPVADTGGEGHSIFSGALLEVLRSNRDVLSADSIYGRLMPRVHEASERLGVPQRPRFGVMDGEPEDGGRFFLVPAGRDEGGETPAGG